MACEPNLSPDSVDDEASFLAFVRALEADRRLAASDEREHRDVPVRGWENVTIEQFLDAAFAWADDSGFGRLQDLGEQASPWRRFAAFLYAGKRYE